MLRPSLDLMIPRLPGNEWSWGHTAIDVGALDYLNTHDNRNMCKYVTKETVFESIEGNGVHIAPLYLAKIARWNGFTSLIP